MKARIDDGTLSVDGVAAKLGCSRSTVFNLVRIGTFSPELRPPRHGGYRFKPEDVDEYVEEQNTLTQTGKKVTFLPPLPTKQWTPLKKHDRELRYYGTLHPRVTPFEAAFGVTIYDAAWAVEIHPQNFYSLMRGNNRGPLDKIADCANTLGIPIYSLIDVIMFGWESGLLAHLPWPINTVQARKQDVVHHAGVRRYNPKRRNNPPKATESLDEVTCMYCRAQAEHQTTLHTRMRTTPPKIDKETRKII